MLPLRISLRMRQDVYHQRRTEIDFITGYLLQAAKRHHIETRLRTLTFYLRIKQIEEKLDRKNECKNLSAYRHQAAKKWKPSLSLI